LQEQGSGGEIKEEKKKKESRGRKGFRARTAYEMEDRFGRGNGGEHGVELTSAVLGEKSQRGRKVGG